MPHSERAGPRGAAQDAPAEEDVMTHEELTRIVNRCSGEGWDPTPARGIEGRMVIWTHEHSPLVISYHTEPRYWQVQSDEPPFDSGFHDTLGGAASEALSTITQQRKALRNLEYPLAVAVCEARKENV